MWLYRTETFDSMWNTEATLKEKSDEILKQAGEEGWELVNFQCAGLLGSTMIFVFKKKADM